MYNAYLIRQDFNKVNLRPDFLICVSGMETYW